MFDPTDQQLVLQTIRDVAGEAGMKAVRAARGGTEVWIPLDPEPDHWLSVALGHKAAQEISRRLTVFNAEGHRTCNMRCYVGLGRSRIQEFKAQIASEICEALLSGMGVRETALKLRVADRDVSKQHAHLIAVGLLSAALPIRRVKTAFTSPTASQQVEERKQLWDIRNAIVDDGLLKGHSTRKVSMAAEVSPSHVRLRRKMLLASGRMKPGRIGADGASVCSLSDHSANVGEMVATPSREVP